MVAKDDHQVNTHFGAMLPGLEIVETNRDQARGFNAGV
jgi:hypothetical protein